MTELRAVAGTAEDSRTAESDPEFHRHLMEDMLFARRASERLWNLQRQGQITTVAPLTGQEAAIVGVVRALDLAHDWLAPYYRELVGMAALGDEFLEQVVSYWRGSPDGGRIPDGVLCLPPQISLGAQIPHATGIAWSLKLQGKPGVACAFIGDGATSEGDFYEGLNLAGVQHVPLLVVVLNNGWAISTPTSRQTAARTLAAKADAVGVPSVRVDGNDVLAVVETARAARALAVSGEGPQLLELVTYRMGAHTNSDDPTRYVPPADLAAWRERDPIEQFRARLAEAGEWDDATHQALVDEVEARLERIVVAAFEHPVDPNDALDHVTAVDSPRLARERAELATRVAGQSEARDDGDISWRP
jgi:pyruvate dehydrogenase E1 component alpha subunit